MSNTGIFRDVVAKLMEGTTIDENNKLQVIDESIMAEADELLDGLLKETARDWWMQMESAEDSLASMQDEISFSEMNTDPSHVVSSPLALDTDSADAPTMESMLGESEFNLDSIFNEGDDDFGPTDGDEQYDDMTTGNDELGLGDDTPTDVDGSGYDDDMDSMGDDGMEDPMGDEFGNAEEFDFSWLDDPMDDEFGDNAGDSMGDDLSDPMGDEGEFDDDMGDPMEGFMESDEDEDEDEDDKDDDKCDDEDDE